MGLDAIVELEHMAFHVTICIQGSANASYSHCLFTSTLRLGNVESFGCSVIDLDLSSIHTILWVQ